MREMDPLSSRSHSRNRYRSRLGVSNREHWVSKHRQNRVRERSKQWGLGSQLKQGSERHFVEVVMDFTAG